MGGDGGRRAVGAALGVEVGVTLLTAVGVAQLAEVGVTHEVTGFSTNFFCFVTLAVAATRGAEVAVVTTVRSARCPRGFAVAATLGALTLAGRPAHVVTDGTVVRRRIPEDTVAAMEVSAVVAGACVAGG